RGIGCISWDGEVHADQFWRHYSFGNVRQRPFSAIWTDLSTPLMARLKDKQRYVTGRCARCRWLSGCGGNFRVRAEALNGDLWAPDPACYLTEVEIS
ncbi:MAG: SPASM domain-containing protein, partial [Deltaproteobacteria bacterium]